MVTCYVEAILAAVISYRALDNDNIVVSLFHICKYQSYAIFLRKLSKGSPLLSQS